MPPRVEILYFDGCPHLADVAHHVRALLESEGVAAYVELRRVADDADARAARFLGSPSVRIDGRDVEPGAERRDDFGMKCRLYWTDGGFRSAPPERLIVEGVRDASG